MTMIPMYKRCPICKKKYSWNPDVGQMFCPNCISGGTKETGKEIVGKIADILSKKKGENKREIQ